MRFLQLLPRQIILLFAFCTAVLAQNQPAAFEPKAPQIYLIEAGTGTILYARNEDVAVPPASLAKLMTMEVVFDALRRGEISLDTTYPVSEHAWRTGGAPSRTSTMFAALKSEIRVGDLIQGVIVQSANDGCIILAEGISGSEEAFAERMTKRARELGLTTSTFGNASGLPDAKSKVTMRELVLLSRHMARTYPDYYRTYSQPEFEWNKILQRNRNPLLGLNIGVDGIGTGYTEASGYAIAASMKRGGKHLILAMSGLESGKERAEEARRVLEWAVASFEKKRLFEAGEAIGEASVYGGDRSTVPVVTKEPVEIFVAVNNPERLTARVVYRWPLEAPVSKGQTIGVLKVWSGDKLLRETPVETAGEAGVGSLGSRTLDALQELLFFWL